MPYDLCNYPNDERGCTMAMSGGRMRGGHGESGLYQALEASKVNNKPSRLDMLPQPLQKRSNRSQLANGESDILHLNMGLLALVVSSNTSHIQRTLDGSLIPICIMFILARLRRR